MGKAGKQVTKNSKDSQGKTPGGARRGRPRLTDGAAISQLRRAGFEQLFPDDRWGNGSWRPPASYSVLTEEDVSRLFPDMETRFVPPTDVGETSETEFVFPAGCVHHGLRLPLEENLAKLLVHFDCSIAEFLPLAMLIYERARQLEGVFKVPFGYGELIRYFHLTPVMGYLQVEFYKKDFGPIGLPQNYHSWRARWFAAARNRNRARPGLIRTSRRARVPGVNRRIPYNKNTELNLKFYLEGIDGEWKKMQRHWSTIRSY